MTALFLSSESGKVKRNRATRSDLFSDKLIKRKGTLSNDRIPSLNLKFKLANHKQAYRKEVRNRSTILMMFHSSVLVTLTHLHSTGLLVKKGFDIMGLILV